MRRLATALILLLVGYPSAAAGEGGGGVQAKKENSLTAGVRDEKSRQQAPSPRQAAGRAGSSGKPYYPWVRHLSELWAEAEREGRPATSVIYDCLDNPEACRRPGTSGGRGNAASPIDAVYRVWTQDIGLPDPIVALPPGRAIAGLDICMILSGPQTMTFDKTVFGYRVQIEATSTYDVDWGSNDSRPGQRSDRYTTGKTTQGAYCDRGGTIRHQYTRRGPVTIVVTQRWTAQWRVGADSGVIADELRTTTTLTDFPVVEVQAVITSR